MTVLQDLWMDQDQIGNALPGNTDRPDGTFRGFAFQDRTFISVLGQFT